MREECAIELDESKIQWEERLSKNGKKFEVGYLKTDNLSDNKKPVAELSDKTDFGISVIWHVESYSDWHPTSTEIRKIAAITSYKLHRFHEVYDYILEFTNTEHYNYFFYDETGDYYQVDTYRNGEHWVRYSSEKPSIIYIKGR